MFAFSWPSFLAHVDWELTFKAIAAAGILITLSFTWRSHQQRTTFEMIDRLYSLCHTLQGHMLHEWRLSHLFCIGGAVYEDTKARIASDRCLKDDLNKLIVEERQFANQIFVMYEQVYYQWRHSRFFQGARREFLSAMLDYFTGRLLQNPRLLAFLESDDVGWTLHLEKESRVELRKRHAKLGTGASSDALGPFGARLGKVPGDEKKILAWPVVPAA